MNIQKMLFFYANLNGTTVKVNFLEMSCCAKGIGVVIVLKFQTQISFLVLKKMLGFRSETHIMLVRRVNGAYLDQTASFLSMPMQLVL